MALWQYTFHILPKINGFTDAFDFCIEKSDNDFDDSVFWRLVNINKNIFIDISLILPISKSWSEQIDLYGDETSNCLNIFSENNMVLSVSLRIDFTSNYETILNTLIYFCISNSFIIIDEELKVVQLNFLTIKSVLDNCIQQINIAKFL